MSIFYVDGAFVQADEAFIPATDLAVLRGYGAFDFLRTYQGRPFRLGQNLARLRRSAALIGLEYPWSDGDIAAIVYETLRRNAGLADEFAIRIVVTGGSSIDNITPQGQPRLLVMVTPLQPPPAWWYERGVKAISVTYERILHAAKSINYIPAIMALKLAREQGAVEALYLNRCGCVTEGTTTNLFVFYGDRLVTPGEDVLPGITRGVVLELARSHYDVVIRELPYDELALADEAFLTAANKQIVPLVQLDDTVLGSGQPGPRTRHLMDLFQEETRRLVEMSR
ncbi:MAG: aminotransferase class IV [Anaerolineae bacterium]|nr:aminotransferase class IV [Anaerolineae bacterium]MDW8171731.1 aminotransferase class IV [Anaerolineae bacterium]